MSQPHYDANLIRRAAHGFLTRHIAEHLHYDYCRLIERCACHLMDLLAISHKSAVLTSLQMLGEVESAHSTAYIDVSHSTSYAVFVVDPSSHRVLVFTAAELMALAVDAPKLDIARTH